MSTRPADPSSRAAAPSRARRQLAFAKGHGTGNDFVLLPDPDGVLDVSAELTQELCDRRFGVGGDGLLRVVRTAASGEFPAEEPPAPWFMDYRNRDGSLAEMCGNGVRVFARYLVDSGLEPGPRVTILTRSGVVDAEVDADAVSVELPLPTVAGAASARLSGVDFAGTVVHCGNPNLVCWVDDPDRLELGTMPTVDAHTFPAGANIEFITASQPLRVRMRVVERGVGETLSCGSGACAAAAVALMQAGLPAGQVTVDLPGGQLSVGLTAQRCVLTGPAVIVASGTVAVP